MKRNLPPPIFLAALAILSFLQFNCKKQDFYLPKPNATEKFFTVPSGTNAQVLRVMDEIKKRNNRS